MTLLSTADYTDLTDGGDTTLHDHADAAGRDTTAIHDNVNGEINAITNKAVPATSDIFLIEDSIASNAKKKVTLSSIATLEIFNASDIRGDDVYASIAPADGELLTWDNGNSRWDAVAPSGLHGSDAHLFHAYDTTGGTTISTGWTDIPLDTEVKDGSDYTHDLVTNNDEVTINSTGYYKLTYDVTFNNASTTTDRNAITALQVDTGGGFAELVGTRSAANLSGSGSGNFRGTASCTTYISFTATDKVKIVALSSHATDVTLFADGSRMTIERVT
jgi:hypothetical protein